MKEFCGETCGNISVVSPHSEIRAGCLASDKPAPRMSAFPQHMCPASERGLRHRGFAGRSWPSLPRRFPNAHVDALSPEDAHRSQ
jgi:hypothetical protein